MNPIPLQANIRTRSLVARADGTPIIAGTVNYYLVALTGANAGNWFRTSDNSWQAAEAIAGVMSHLADGDWSVSVDAEAWPTAGVEYTEYAKEDGDLHVPTSMMIRCEYAPFVIAPGAANGVFIAGTNAETTVTTAINANLIGNITGNLSGSVGSVAGAVGSVGAGGIVAASFGAGAINAAAIAAGAIDNATFAADVGTTAYASNHIALATRKALDNYDPPTNAEMELRTLVAANYFVVGDYTAPNNTAIGAIETVVTHATYGNAAIRTRGDIGWITGSGTSTLTAAQVLTAFGTGSTLTTCATATGFATAAKLLAYIQLIARSDNAIKTDNAAEVTEINASGGSGAGNWDNTDDSFESIYDEVAGVRAEVDNIFDDVGDVKAQVDLNAGYLYSIMGEDWMAADNLHNIRLYVDCLPATWVVPPSVAQLNARTLLAASYFDFTTDSVITDAASRTASKATGFAVAGDAMALTAAERLSTADAILGRSVETCEGSAAEWSLCTIILAALESSIEGTVWTIKRTDGTTTHATKTVEVDSDADPIVGVE